jgi:hypothetical protein
MVHPAHGDRHKLRELLEIGWCELVDLPELGLANMHAKIDTGASTSSLHATRIREFERDGEPWVRFRSPRSVGHGPKDCEARLLEQRHITSSTGHRQERHVIVTEMRLGPLTWMGELTLANRATMAFPVLIGRKALRRGFLVNSAKRWTLGKPE